MRDGRPVEGMGGEGHRSVCLLILMQPRIPWEEGFSGGSSRSSWPVGMSAGVGVVLLIN